MSFTTDIIRTLADRLRIGSLLLKEASQGFVIRNAADTGNADLTCNELIVAGSAASDRAVRIQRSPTATAAYNFVLPPNPGVTGDRVVLSAPGILAFAGGGNANLDLNSINYDWSAGEGFLRELRSFQSTNLKVLFRATSNNNLPVRVRFYSTAAARARDLDRPPYIDPVSDRGNQGLLLDVIFQNEILLTPVVAIAGTDTIYATVEKLFLNSAAVNIKFDFVG